MTHKLKMDSSTAIRFNPEHESRAHRWEISCDAGIFYFQTRGQAVTFQAALTLAYAANDQAAIKQLTN